MTRNGYEAVLKLVHFLNDKVMTSDCMVICCIDPATMDDRQYHILLTEMNRFDEQGHRRFLEGTKTFTTEGSKDQRIHRGFYRKRLMRESPVIKTSSVPSSVSPVPSAWRSVPSGDPCDL